MSDVIEKLAADIAGRFVRYFSDKSDEPSAADIAVGRLAMGVVMRELRLCPLEAEALAEGESVVVPREATDQQVAAVVQFPEALVREREERGHAGYRRQMEVATLAEQAEARSLYNAMVRAAASHPQGDQKEAK